MNMPMEQKTLYKIWEGKETSFQKELVENYFWNGGNHFQLEDVLWGSQHDNQVVPPLEEPEGEVCSIHDTMEVEKPRIAMVLIL